VITDPGKFRATVIVQRNLCAFPQLGNPTHSEFPGETFLIFSQFHHKASEGELLASMSTVMDAPIDLCSSDDEPFSSPQSGHSEQPKQESSMGSGDHTNKRRKIQEAAAESQVATHTNTHQDFKTLT
jgi:hypothetical protein